MKKRSICIGLGIVSIFISARFTQNNIFAKEDNTTPITINEGQERELVQLNLLQVENSCVNIGSEMAEGTTRVELYRSTSNNDEFVKIAKQESFFQYSDTSIEFHKTYYYKAIFYGQDKVVESEIATITTKGPIAPSASSCSWVCGSNLYWTPQQNVTTYEIYRSASPTTGFTYLTNTTTNAYNDLLTEYNKTFYYKIRAKVIFNNKTYYSPFSNVVNINIHLDATVVNATSKSTGVSLTWKPVDYATSYYIYRSTKPTTEFKRYTQVSGDKQSYNDVGFSTAPNTTYYYRVVAIETTNNIKGNVSNTVSGKVLVASPKTISIKYGSPVNASQVKLTWSATSGATGYQIYRSTSSKSGFTRIATTSKVTSYTDTSKSLIPNYTYYYKIRPIKKYYNWYVYGSYSGYKRVKTSLPSTSITSVSTPGKGKVIVSWRKVSNARYQIYRSTRLNGSYSLVRTITNGATSCKFSGLRSKQRYYFKVRTTLIPSNRKTYYGSYSGRKSVQVRSTHTKYDVIDTARAQLKKRYKWGGTGPNSFDCSGLIYYSYRQNGYKIPRAVAYAGRSIGKSCRNVVAGDILMYKTHFALVTKVTKHPYYKNYYVVHVIEAMNERDGIKENSYVFTNSGPVFVRLKFVGFRRV